MSIRCQVTESKQLRFYVNKKNKNYPISRDKCIKIGEKKIQDYLGNRGLKIRPLRYSDIKNLEDYDEAENLCGDMDIMIFSILGEIEDENPQDPSQYKPKDGLVRLTYVIVPRDKPKHILGLLSAIINYRDEYLSKNIPEFYKELLKVNTVYVELGCSYQKPPLNRRVTGTNYFLRSFIILEALKLASVRILWSVATGTVRGKKEELRKLEAKRMCKFYGKTKYSFCDIVEFLNKFFKRVREKNLLRYTKRK